MTLVMYQLQMPNGTILGNGSGVELAGITGLLDMPALRSSDAARGQTDGMISGLNYLGERTVDVTYQITRVPSGTTEQYRAMASAAHQSVQDPSTIVITGGDYLRQIAGIGPTKPVYSVQVQLPNRAQPLMFFGRPTKYATTIDQNFTYGQVNIASEWSCPDGLIYDNTIISGSCGLPNPVAGMTFPATFPVSFGTSSGGNITLTNTGAYNTPAYFVINGPCTQPVIYNNTTGYQIQLDVTLASTDVVGIDCQAGTVTLNGTSNRNSVVDVSSTFFQLVPGANSIGFASIDSIAVAGTLTGYALPAYSNA